MLLASDLGEMIYLKSANVRFAELFTGPDDYHPPEGLEAAAAESYRHLTMTAKQILGRFLPWEGYPHKLVGTNGIIRFGHW